MTSFFHRELSAHQWMRALSLDDDLVAHSSSWSEGGNGVYRPDHGINGAFDAWPALSSEALSVLSGYHDAVAFLHQVGEGVKGKGPFGQAHEIPSSSNNDDDDDDDDEKTTPSSPFKTIRG